MKYTRKEAKAFFDWFEKRDFDYHEKTKENYMMEAFIKGMQLVKESDSLSCVSESSWIVRSIETLEICFIGGSNETANQFLGDSSSHEIIEIKPYSTKGMFYSR